MHSDKIKFSTGIRNILLLLLLLLLVLLIIIIIIIIMFEENFCIIHRSALFLVLGKELTKSKNNIPFKLGFYISTYFLIYPQAKNMPTQIMSQ